MLSYLNIHSEPLLDMHTYNKKLQAKCVAGSDRKWTLAVSLNAHIYTYSRPTNARAYVLG